MNMPKLSAADTRNLLFSVLNRRQRAEFEEKKEIDFALSTAIADDQGTEKTYRFRVNGFFQKGAISLALRVINQVIPNPTSLGLAPAIIEMADKPHGLVLGAVQQGMVSRPQWPVDRPDKHSRSCHIIPLKTQLSMFIRIKRQLSSNESTLIQLLKCYEIYASSGSGCNSYWRDA